MTAVPSDALFIQQARNTLAAILRLLPNRPFVVRLPDGSELPPADGVDAPPFTFVLKRPAALRRIFLPPSELAMGEAYIFDDFDVEGDIVAAFQYIDSLEVTRPSLIELARLIWNLLRLQRLAPGRQSATQQPAGRFHAYEDEGELHSPDRDQRASQFHYDLSNTFYKLWLDERMVYSCGYFADPDETLDVAQERKLDRICRKLDLRPGERFLDIGCGFGGLLIHAAGEYGVRATGISLSAAQTAEAQARIRRHGLEARCYIDICHYEQYEPERPFDKIASVGMFEHVGEQKLEGYFARVMHWLRPGGLFLLQGGSARGDRRHVGRSWMDRLGLGRNAFMQKYSFPDSRLIDIPTVLATAENAGFETYDVESLREHYPLTLRHWLDRLEGNREKIVAEVGEPAYRAWRLILAGYLHLLNDGQLTEYQTILSKPPPSGLTQSPLVRPC